MIKEFEARGLINSERIEFKLDKFYSPRSVLSYPGELEVDPARGRIFISDPAFMEYCIILALFSPRMNKALGPVPARIGQFAGV